MTRHFICVWNQIYGWEPKPYTYHEVETNTTTEGVAINMPEHLRRKVLDIGLVDGEINLARQQIVNTPAIYRPIVTLFHFSSFRSLSHSLSLSLSFSLSFSVFSLFSPPGGE